MVKTTTLDNGIRVITENIPSALSVTVGFWVENGSRHESASLNGISHFIEHMLFKGTGQRGALAIAKEIDSVGGVLNGFTSREYSCYYAKILARQLPMAIDLLTDIFLNSAFDPEEIEKERRVILQEIHMLEDTPDDYVHDLFSRKFWRDQGLGLPVLGTEETVSILSRELLLNFLAERYCGRNVLICAAGNLHHETIVASVAGSFSRLQMGQRLEVPPCAGSRRGFNADDRDLEQIHLCLGTQALPQRHPDRYESYLLNSILGGSMSSRLFQRIREEEGLAYSIYSYLNSHSDAGSLVIYAGTAPEDALKVVRIMLEELGRLKSAGVSTEELQSAKEQLKGNLILSLESTDNRMTRLAKNEIYLGRQVGLKEVLGEIERVSREGIHALADTIFQDQFLNLQAFGRIGETDLNSLQLTIEG